MTSVCDTPAMRWDRLFDDLEGQAEAADAAELAGEIDERVRIEQGRVAVGDRLRAARGTSVDIAAAGHRLCGVVVRVAADAVVIEEGERGQVLLALRAIDWIQGLSRAATGGNPGPVAAGLGLRSLLRGVVRDRATVRIRLRDAELITGTIDAVGSDWLEIAEHPPDVPRRRAAITRVRLVPFDALVSVAIV